MYNKKRKHTAVPCCEEASFSIQDQEELIACFVAVPSIQVVLQRHWPFCCADYIDFLPLDPSADITQHGLQSTRNSTAVVSCFNAVIHHKTLYIYKKRA